MGGKFDEKQAKEYFRLLKTERNLVDKYGGFDTGADDIHQMFARFKNDINPLAKFYGDQLQNAAKATDDFEASNVELVNFIEKHQIKNYEQLTAAAEQYGVSIRNLLADVDGESTGIESLGATYSSVTDQLKNFSDTREEMFYGFDRNNLTGDLVRQVTQQGVETLVTTTEVIMTNNFNGMTVPEVADMIIEEIENRGNLRGYNLSTA